MNSRVTTSISAPVMLKPFVSALLVSTVVLLGLSLGTSCDTEINLNAPFQETAVLFCLLDESETTHYVRVNRAYLQDGADALLLATDPNEIYYDDRLVVSMEEVDANGNVVSNLTLERVDGDTIGIIKEEGTFANSPNILYRYVRELNPAYTYRVRARSTELEIDLSAETELLSQFNITRPTPNPGINTAISFAPLSDYQVRWNVSGDAKLFDIDMRFFYRVYSVTDPNTAILDTFATWPIVRGIVAPTGDLSLEYDVPRNGFFNFVQREIPFDADLYYQADSVDFVWFAGDGTLFDYAQFTSAQLGITENQISPEFTNVEGGLGLFASRYKQATPRYRMSNQSIDSVACGFITSGTNWITHDNQVVCP
jgi:hypothetical protein